MELDVEEALRYLGASAAPEELRRQVGRAARDLAASIQPRYVYRVFPLDRTGGAPRLAGTDAVLSGGTAAEMLAGCERAAVLACTLGARFDLDLLAAQARDMARAVILDACGSALVEAGCGAAEAELAHRLPGQYLTDRFSPGYGDLPLSLQPALCAALDAERRLGLRVTSSLLLEPVKSVTAVVGLSAQPQPARIRGCGHCSMREVCQLRKGGRHCGS